MSGFSGCRRVARSNCRTASAPSPTDAYAVASTQIGWTENGLKSAASRADEAAAAGRRSASAAYASLVLFAASHGAASE